MFELCVFCVCTHISEIQCSSASGGGAEERDHLALANRPASHTHTHSLTHTRTHSHTHTHTHTHPHSHTQLLLEQHGPHIPPHTVEKKRERNEMLQQIPQCQVQHCPNNILSLTVFLTAVLHWLAPPIVNSHWPKISLCMTVKHQICSD